MGDTIPGLYIPVYLPVAVNKSYTISDICHDPPYIIDVNPHRQ